MTLPIFVPRSTPPELTCNTPPTPQSDLKETNDDCHNGDDQIHQQSHGRTERLLAVDGVD